MPQREWPRTATSPPAWSQHPDGYWNSNRALVGPLRRGTARGPVGPASYSGPFYSDMGVDRTSLPRYMDAGGKRTTGLDTRPVRLSNEIAGRRR